MSNIRKGKSFIGGAANQTFNGNDEFSTINYAQATGGIFADLSKGTVTREFTPSVKNPLKILPVGDSITHGFINTELEGEDRNEGNGGYRKFLDEKLGEAVDFVGSKTNGDFGDNEHEGHGGQTISFISDLIKNSLNVQQPDMLLLMIGTNDTKGNPIQASQRLDSLLDKITNHSPTTHLLVASIPPIDQNLRPDQSKNVKTYNAQIPGIVEQKVRLGNKVTFVDINSALTVNDIYDGVHPSDQGYEKIADSWYDWIESSQDTLTNIDHITGTFYDDELIGNENDNVIEGGAGDDSISGGAGDDLITGGAGKDTFALALGEGTDTITDFSVSEDSLDLWLGLTFDQLSINQGTGEYINDTWISHINTGEQLALLLGVQAELVNNAIEPSDSSLLDISIDGVTRSEQVESYGGASQSPDLTTTISSNNTQLQLEGNGWGRLNLNGYQVTSETVLSFEFNSNGKGEVLGIGFDNDNNISSSSDSQRFFQVDGNQSWGRKQSSIGESDGFKQYSIQVGDFFTGQFDYLTIGNDHDVNNPDAIGVFRNIELLSTVVTPDPDADADPNPNPSTSLDISIDGVIQSEEVKSYGKASQSPDITTTISTNSTQLQLEGNGWRRLNINGYEVTSETVLRFEFNSNGKGEVQGIGFDKDNNISSSSDSQRFFQVDGNQSWGRKQSSIGESDGFKQYSIQVGDFFTGQFDYLTIGNDHDVNNPDAIGVFRNIELLSTVVTPDPTPDPTPSNSLDISINGVTRSEEVESYGKASQSPNITTTITNSNTQLQLEGNGWRRLDITGYQINANSELQFEFRSNGAGEIQGIGFDSNNTISSSSDAQHFFQVDGNQSWGIEELGDYYIGSSDDGFEKYSISIDNFSTGQFNYLTIGNDHDVSNPTAMGEFRNISLT